MNSLEDQTGDQNKLINKDNSKILPTEIVITTHHIFSLIKEFDDDIYEILHRDLFDKRREVVLSALNAIKRIASVKSIPYISRLFENKDKSILTEAIKTIGEIRDKEMLPTLIDMFKITQDEQLRFRVLEALLKIDQNNPEVKTLLRAYAASPVISGKAKADAVGLLLKYDNEANIEYFLKDPMIKNDLIEKLTSIYNEVPRIKDSLVLYGNNKWKSLSVIQKISIIKVAAPYTSTTEKDILLKGLLDIHPDVRKIAYKNIGISQDQKDIINEIVEFLINGTEKNGDVEDEAIQCIKRIENIKNSSGISINKKFLTIIEEKIFELFQQLSRETRRIMSDTHELGWFIVHGKEYLEFYSDEEFKQELINYLKKSSNYSLEELLNRLKNTAIRVEVGHFSGYNAIRDLIKNPDRNGIALIARELSLAKPGKKSQLWLLIRLLYLNRLLNWKDENHLAEKIYDWAYRKKFFRLAEAALYALKLSHPEKAEIKIKENLSTPIISKILTLASLRLLNKNEFKLYRKEIEELISNNKDLYIISGIINTIDGLFDKLERDLQILLLKRFIWETNEEINSRIITLFEKKADTVLIEPMMGHFKEIEYKKRILLLEAFKKIVLQNGLKNEIGLNEFLYKILREEKNGEIKSYILAMLYEIDDDYSPKAVQSFLENASNEDAANLISMVSNLNKMDIDFITRYLVQKNDLKLHSAFRKILDLSDEAFITLIKDKFLEVRTGKLFIDNNKNDFVNSMINDFKIDFSREKRAYQFEHENMKSYTVVFTDIEGYTHKSLNLTEMELASLIADYESLLIPIFNQHSGKLIKRIGDGHLFVFEKPVNAVLAALRFEKSLKRFNDYREEKFKVISRVGIHHGQVILENGDVLGNTVNLASRLEESAKGGRIYISDIVYNDVKNFFHTNKIGEIMVKGIEKPVMVYEPYEIMVSFPEELDPAKKDYKNTDIKNTGYASSSPSKINFDMDDKIISYIKHTFTTINQMCKKAEKGEIEVSLIRNELRRRWSVISKVLI